MPTSILIVEDEKNTRNGLRIALEDEYEVFEARDAEEAFRLMDEEPFELILTDLRMAGKSGMSVIDKASTLAHKPICIMMTAYGDVSTAVEAMKRGAFDFLTKPVNLEELEILIKRALRTRHLEIENIDLHERLDEKFSLKGVIGNSKRLHEALDEIKLVAPSKATVLLYGETGTGKEIFAQIIHQNSKRSREPFIPVHCASLPSNLLESELFGHEKGAFTGAHESRMGRFESADKGTLFLDEIGEIDSATQVKLLRFIETKTFERVGSSKPITVDVRLICATNRNLEMLVKEGKFREDLLYRLNVITVKLPPLRERTGDIHLLLEHYLNYFSKENNIPPTKLSSGAFKVLSHYNWPGNIRELRNFCENLTVMHSGKEISEHDLDLKFSGKSTQRAEPEDKGKELSREEHERELIAKTLHKARGNKSKAAKLMGISRRTLYRKLSQWPELLH